MKLSKSALFGTGIVIALCLCSCDVPVDRGVFNPNGVPDDQLVLVTIAPHLAIQKVDNVQVYWTRPDNGYSQKVRMAPGIHLFEITFNNGSTWTLQPISAIADFSVGKNYGIECIVDDNKLSIKIVSVTGGVEENAMFNQNSISDKEGAFPSFVKYVFNPTQSAADAKVQLENDDAIIVFEPDLAYRATDKKTGKTTEGRDAVEMDFSMNGRVYMLETALAEMSSEAFLASNFREAAQTIVVPVACDEEKVTFQYVKPETLRGQEVTYIITDFTKKDGSSD
jgi:hypothetical protein